MNTLSRTYAPHVPRTLFLRDSSDERREILFHIRSQDYFGTAATIVDLVIDALEFCGRERKPTPDMVYSALKHLKSDLVYLQGTHQIVPKRSYKR